MDISQTRKRTVICAAAGSLAICLTTSVFAQPFVFSLTKGPMADYGATPWYTADIFLGQSPIAFTLDTGTPLLWATSDQCQTPACNAHQKVDTTQPEFSWQGTEEDVDFGPWGKMTVRLAKIPFKFDGMYYDNDLVFNASTKYIGPKFEFLTWGGGIGLPSESSSVKGYDSFFHRMFFSGAIGRAFFSFFTDGQTGTGAAVLGGDDPSRYAPETEVVLEAKKSENPKLDYLWGTSLHDLKIGSTSLPELKNQTFYLDTGSSRFKGDDRFVYPIMNELLRHKDAQGRDIFEKYYEDDGKGLIWTGLKYANGGTPFDYPDLPPLNLTLGSSCGKTAGALSISLSPRQYAYQVETGERAGEWAVAVHRLDGVTGLLVGSTFMDLVYTRFEYGVDMAQQKLTQGWMFLFRTLKGDQPAKYTCVPVPANFSAKAVAP